MLSILKKHWFLIALAAAALWGYVFPATGEFLVRYEVLTTGLVISFLLTGLTLDSHVVVNALGSM